MPTTGSFGDCSFPVHDCTKWKPAMCAMPNARASALNRANPFAKAADAFRALEKGTHFGKIVIDFKTD